jgi:SAM-dependent methyltransferase
MNDHFDFHPYAQRYERNEDRARIFYDIVREETLRHTQNGVKPTLLDIGCGKGFHGSETLQRALAASSGYYIGVEPDQTLALGDYFSEAHRSFFEDAPLRSQSVDIAFAVMVLEHIAEPERFWVKLYDVLRKGGVFWGFTIHARHYFTAVSLAFERLGVKDIYLDVLHGRRGVERYENYPTFYQMNTPSALKSQTQAFAEVQTWTLHKVGQLDYYYPRGLRWIGRTIDRLTKRQAIGGSGLAIRVVK